jgi:exodeoxyribonuclease VII large subunit
MMPDMIKDPFARLGLDREVLTVSQLNGRARVLLEDVFSNIWVEGEISNLARPASGHVYFTLKDSGAQVRCALFRQNAAKVRQALKDGLAVKVRGKVSLFEGRGDYQLILDTVEPAGDGALRQAFEALKEKLDAEGLFRAERKVALPAHPRRIGIVSSPTGAVIRDIISVFRRRAPQVELTLVPTAVQGREAINQIVRALKLADNRGFDAIILARGGGSLEDLWCFNEEAVARAIDACVTPIVSAVGHETDVSISDFVADVRAPTPSAAAELLAPDMGDLQRRIENLQRRLLLRMRNQLAHHSLRLEGLTRRLRHPGERLRQQAQRLDDLDMRLRRAFEQRLEQRKQRLAHLDARLATQHPGRALALLKQRLTGLDTLMRRAMEQRLKRDHERLSAVDQRLPKAITATLKDRRQQLQTHMQTLHVVSPLATLGRGYSILLDEHGQAIRSAEQTRTGQRLTARLGEGELDVRVEDNHLTPVTLSLLD